MTSTLEHRDAVEWHATTIVKKWQPKTMVPLLGDLGLLLPGDYTTFRETGQFDRPIDSPSFEELMRLTGAPDEVLEEIGNVLVAGGKDGLWYLATGVGTVTTAWNNASARLGVGSGNTGAGPATVTAAATDTGLATTVAADRYYQLMDATYPAVRTQTNVNDMRRWQATFGTAVANFEWNEWLVDNNAAGGAGTVAGGIALNHKGGARPWLGTKTNAASWTLDVDIYLT